MVSLAQWTWVWASSMGSQRVRHDLSTEPSSLKQIIVISGQWHSVQFSRSVVSDFLWPQEQQHVRPPSPSPTSRVYLNSCPLSQWCHPTILSCHPLLFLPSVFPNIGVFSNESAIRIKWPKYWSFNFSISPSNEYSGLISFRIDWLDLFAVQGTLKSLLQHHSWKASL